MRYVTIFLICLVAAACGSKQLTVGEDAVKVLLKDPRSAEFRAEKIRTLWSDNGDRLKVYCGEVNANNGFGGKAGFQPAIAVLEAKSSRPDDVFGWQPGKAYIFETEVTDYYLMCERADTQRKSGTLFFATPDLYDTPEQMRRAMDVEIPAISSAAAPK